MILKIMERGSFYAALSRHRCKTFHDFPCISTTYRVFPRLSVLAAYSQQSFPFLPKTYPRGPPFRRGKGGQMWFPTSS